MTPIRVLLVDDEEGVRKAWSKALQNDGFTTLVAESGKTALKLCDEHNFDVVVVDFIMPHMDGVQLLARIRKTHPYVRSIVVSGKIDAQHENRTVEGMLRDAVEADMYLRKPVHNDDLCAAIRSLMNPKQPPEWTEIAKTIASAGAKRMKDVKRSTAFLKPRGHRRKKK